jgi:hypothetical protein
MGLLYCDGFDSYSATADLSRNYTVGANWTWAATAGRNAGPCIQSTLGSSSITGPLINTWSVSVGNFMGVCFWLKISAAPNATTTFLTTGGETVGVTSGGLIQFVQGPTNGITQIADNNWHWIEFKTNCGNVGTPANHACWVDGVLQWSGNLNGNNATSTNISFTSLATNGIITIDDLFIIDNVSPAPQAASMPLGPKVITTLRPASDSSVQFSPDSGVTNFSRVNETSSDEDTSYVQDNTSGHVDLYGYGGLGFIPSTVTSVQVTTRARNPASGSVSYKTRCSSGGSTSDSAAVVANSNYQHNHTVYNQDPHTSAAWTPSGLAAALFGITVV